MYNGNVFTKHYHYTHNQRKSFKIKNKIKIVSLSSEKSLLDGSMVPVNLLPLVLPFGYQGTKVIIKL